MKKTLILKRFFVYSASQNQFYHTPFGDNINIIHGANTSGKSTLIQSLLYTFGINSVSKYFEDIYQKDTIFRLDCKLYESGTSVDLIIIRHGGHIYIKNGKSAPACFFGIDSDQSAEHILLKEFYHKLFNFNLSLLSSNGKYTLAPIETIFLPYYIAQSVGWVALRKSFENLDFYKNFKEDYLDYYLGIEINQDNREKIRLRTEIKDLESTQKLLSEFTQTDIELGLSILEDESLKEKALEYFENYKKQEEELIKKESEYLLLCNKLGYLKSRKTLLAKVNRNLKKQNPMDGSLCPSCNQALVLDFASKYQFHQQQNDTLSEAGKVNKDINRVASEINTLKKNIEGISQSIQNKYNLIKEHRIEDISFDRWMKNKANSQMINEIDKKRLIISDSIDRLRDEFSRFKNDDEIRENRTSKEYSFRRLFEQYLTCLRVKRPEENRFLDLYRISFFPKQGVELHKTMLAYHFAFNQLINKSEQIHRFPFILDAIFKEDIDPENKKIILDFINNNSPSDTQIFISIADKEEDHHLNASSINKEHFQKKAFKIHIGNSSRTFLRNWDDAYSDFLNETYSFMS